MNKLINIFAEVPHHRTYKFYSNECNNFDSGLREYIDTCNSYLTKAAAAVSTEVDDTAIVNHFNSLVKKAIVEGNRVANLRDRKVTTRRYMKVYHQVRELLRKLAFSSYPLSVISKTTPAVEGGINIPLVGGRGVLFAHIDTTNFGQIFTVELNGYEDALEVSGTPYDFELMGRMMQFGGLLQ